MLYSIDNLIVKRPLLNLNLLKTIVLSFLILSGVVLKAQQDPYFTHYFNVQQLYNPASIGLDGKWCAFGIVHTQYMWMEDQTPLHPTPGQAPLPFPNRKVGPKTNGLGIAIPFNKYDKQTSTITNFGGIGLTVFDDRLGYESNLNIRLQTAYRYNIQPGKSLAFGIDAGMLQKGIDGEKLRYIDPNDPNIPTGEETDAKFTGSLGLYYSNEDANNLNIGISSTNLLPQDYRYGLNGSVVMTTARHYYGFASMRFDNFMGNPLLQFRPSVLMKYNSLIQVDATALVEWNQFLWGGLAFRSITDAACILVGGTWNDVRLGLSYDVTLSRLRQVSFGSFEVSVNYCWQVIPKEKFIIPIIDVIRGDVENW